jgi:hypothetical protein
MKRKSSSNNSKSAKLSKTTSSNNMENTAPVKDEKITESDEKVNQLKNKN